MLTIADLVPEKPALAPTPKDAVFRDGTATLYRCRGPAAAGAGGGRAPVLLVPSLINRWYVIDLRKGASICEALVGEGYDVFVLDWGEPRDEDRYLSWDDVLARLARMVRRTNALAGASSLGLLGYCIGGTLAAIHTALRPEGVRALVNLAGPIDFSHAGFLGHMTRPRWFDVDAIADAGNMSAAQMQAGFTQLRPTAQLAKWVTFADKALDPDKRDAFVALETWASDNIAFPAEAYRRYIRELYQENLLVRGEHAVRGERVDLGNVVAPLLTVVTDRDTICPPKAALALAELARSEHKEVLTIPGGHVGAVVGEKAKQKLYPALASFFARHL